MVINSRAFLPACGNTAGLSKRRPMHTCALPLQSAQVRSSLLWGRPHSLIKNLSTRCLSIAIYLARLEASPIPPHATLYVKADSFVIAQSQSDTRPTTLKKPVI